MTAHKTIMLFNNHIQHHDSPHLSFAKDKSANSTAVSGSFFGDSFGFHATTNRTFAETTSYPLSFHSNSFCCMPLDSLATNLWVLASDKIPFL